MSNKVQTKVYLTEEAKALVDSDKRTNSEAVEAAIWDQYGGQKKSAMEVRLENKLNELDAARNTLKDDKSNVRELETEVEQLRKQLESLEDERHAEKEEWFSKLEQVPLEPEHPLVEEAAEELQMTIEELITEAKNR